MIFKPRDYQTKAVASLLEGKKALFADPGTGKTAIILMYLTVLKQIDQFQRTLIIAPKRICQIVWPEEIKQWNQFNHFRYLKYEKENNTLSDLKQIDIAAINCENIFPYIKDLSKHCKILIIDESSKFKNYNSQRFKVLLQYLLRFQKVFILTGTPIPNGYMDLFAQVFLVDRNYLLGKNITAYRTQYFLTQQRLAPNSKKPFFQYSLLPNANKKIDAKIAPLTIRIDSKENPDIPEILYDNIKIKMSKNLLKQYKVLEKELILQLENIDVTASNKLDAMRTCQQFANGKLYIPRTKKETKEVHTLKIEALKELIEELQGKSLLIAYWFNPADIEILKKHFPTIKWLGQKEDKKLIQQWNKGKIHLLAGHPLSVGHGLNLQKGGFHVVWFSMCSHEEEYIQFNRRLARPGSISRKIIVHHLLIDKTIDYFLLRNLQTKGRTQEGFLQSMYDYYHFIEDSE